MNDLIKRSHGIKGFTLVELLAVLLVLTVITTFTIPKLLAFVGLQQRYIKAIDAYATLSGVIDAYLLENGGCFGPDFTCNINPLTGLALDGKPNFSNWGAAPAAYNQLIAYLDSHLGYTRKVVAAPYIYYYLPTGVTIYLEYLSTQTYAPLKRETAAFINIIIDETPEDVILFKYSMIGVDTDYAKLYFFRNRASLAGFNAHLKRTTGVYSSVGADIFDSKEHPGDTCSAVGGVNCGQ